MKNPLPQNHLCSLTLLGNLVTKPDIRYQANPVIAIAEFKLATHSKWFDKAAGQYKEWTQYHTVKMIGDVVERSLLQADKGDIVLIQGFMVNSKNSNREIIHATYAHRYPKGYARSINQLHCSGKIINNVKLVTTENNRQLAEFPININFYVYSPISQELRCIDITRTVHVWGKQADYLKDTVMIGDELIIEGKLNYVNNNSKSQLIDAQHVALHKVS
ncbi:single-stranded DNA-binding protein [Thalassotalea sp. G2M2-11]|uniref:single-stranded DNA-binding protein n=1 Tax=Thalassotalea sp. G2M2-11 TaxID=2787627 RepID=UPI0019CFDE24|nr:single-stranded DNA-binding protein [Thalassotalea sp. G2M2-11]